MINHPEFVQMLSARVQRWVYHHLQLLKTINDLESQQCTCRWWHKCNRCSRLQDKKDELEIFQHRLLNDHARV